jgi:hypothetical protein
MAVLPGCVCTAHDLDEGCCSDEDKRWALPVALVLCAACAVAELYYWQQYNPATAVQHGAGCLCVFCVLRHCVLSTCCATHTVRKGCHNAAV